MKIIDDVFETTNDDTQIKVTQKDIKKLNEIHPKCLSEIVDENGPIIWVLMIPTTQKIMRDFLEKRITEKDILKLTNLNVVYDSIYFCSVTTLPEYRKKGLTKKLCIEVVEEMKKAHPIKNVFVWPFTSDGRELAKKISNETSLNLFFLK
jgi:predicted GNAT family acetyltransferase